MEMTQPSTEAAQPSLRAPGHSWLSEPELTFHADRKDLVSNHPLDGLLRFGPYGQSLVNSVLGPIRVACVAPFGGLTTLDNLLKEMDRAHQPKERKTYLPEFAGFSKVFRLGIVPAAESCRIEFKQSFDKLVAESQTPQQTLAEGLTLAVRRLAGLRMEFDVVLVYLPDKWSSGFRGAVGDDFDLHDYLKAVTADLDIPIQVINDDSALTYFCRCSVMWRLGIALYCKAGGIPWKLAAVDHEAAYVGISYALRSKATDDGRFVTCCSQVFDADGSGLEFVAYSPDEVEVQEGRNPFLTRVEMRRVMARSLALYQRRHAGQNPKRIVVHKTTEFKPEEIDGCFDALQVAPAIDLVQIQDETAWRGILMEAPSHQGGTARAGAYPLLRGTYLPIGPREVLLWSQGDVPSAVGGRHFYKEGKGIPAPILLRRFAGHGGWEQTCRDALGLSKMNWNSDSLYDRLPVTIGFAHTLATIVKRMTSVSNRAYPFRLFM